MQLDTSTFKIAFPIPRSARRALCVGAVLLTFSLPAFAQQRTIVVDAIPGNPTASGQALALAIAGISGASASDTYLVKVGPGLFHLGSGNSAALQMKSWVDMEGAGEGVTTIRSAGFTTNTLGTVMLADNSEVRRLTVRNIGGKLDAIAILNLTTSGRLDHVTAHASGGERRTYGVRNAGAGTEVHMRDVTAIANGVGLGGGGGSGGSSSFGVSLKDLASATLEQVRATASGAGTNYGVSILKEIGSSYAVELNGVIAEASGGSTSAGLISDGNVEVNIAGSSFSGSGASSTNYGMAVRGAVFLPIQISDSTLSATGSGSIGLSNPFGNTVEVDQSRVFGENNTLEGLIFAGASRLDGGPAISGSVCAGVYDENYVFYPSTCP